MEYGWIFREAPWWLCYFSITRVSHLALGVCITMLNRTESRFCFVSLMQTGFLVLSAMLTSLGRLAGCCVTAVKSDQPHVLSGSADSARRSQELMVSSDDGTAKQNCQGLWGTGSRSWSWGAFRGKHSTERGWRGGRSASESRNPCLQRQVWAQNTLEPCTWLEPRHCPRHVIPSMWQGSGASGEIVTSVIKVFCYSSSFCLYAVICSSTTPERTLNIFDFKVHVPKGRDNW